MELSKFSKRNLLLLVASSIGFIFTVTIVGRTNDIWGLLIWIYFSVILISSSLLILNIVKNAEKDKKNKLLINTLLFSMILALFVLLGNHYIGGIYTMILGIGYVALFVKKTLLL